MVVVEQVAMVILVWHEFDFNTATQIQILKRKNYTKQNSKYRNEMYIDDTDVNGTDIQTIYEL